MQILKQTINLVALDQAVANSIKTPGSSTKSALDSTYASAGTVTPDPEHPGFYLIDTGTAD